MLSRECCRQLFHSGATNFIAAAVFEPAVQPAIVESRCPRRSSDAHVAGKHELTSTGSDVNADTDLAESSDKYGQRRLPGKKPSKEPENRGQSLPMEASKKQREASTKNSARLQKTQRIGKILFAVD